MNMEENTQLPVEAVECINNWIVTFALAYHKRKDKDISNDAAEFITDELSMPNALTAYATKLHQANEVIKVLTYDNNKLKGEVEGYKEAHEDHQRLVRHLDILINGDAAAEQASLLCDLVNQIESFGLPAVKNPNYKAGALWVKCWEQKPDTHKVRFKDKHGNEFIGNYSKDTGQYWAYGLGQAINDVIYWQPQDESAAGREDAVEQGAIAFADWGNNNVKGFDPIEEKWVYGEDEKRYTTAQLYTIFKQQRGKV